MPPIFLWQRKTIMRYRRTVDAWNSRSVDVLFTVLYVHDSSYVRSPSTGAYDSWCVELVIASGLARRSIRFEGRSKSKEQILHCSSPILVVFRYSHCRLSTFCCSVARCVCLRKRRSLRSKPSPTLSCRRSSLVMKSDNSNKTTEKHRAAVRNVRNVRSMVLYYRSTTCRAMFCSESCCVARSGSWQALRA